jgi:hypothetical protein
MPIDAGLPGADATTRPAECCLASANDDRRQLAVVRKRFSARHLRVGRAGARSAFVAVAVPRYSVLAGARADSPFPFPKTVLLSKLCS